MSKILVLGSNSPSGASLCAHYLNLGYEVIATSRSPEPDAVFLPYKWTGKNGLVFEQVDLNHDIDFLKSLLLKHRPKYIFNFASQGMVAQSWENPTHWMQTNVVSLTALLEVLRNLDFLDRYVHFSTPEVYGSTEGWVKENRNFKPSTPYAASRAAGDVNVDLWTRPYDLPIVTTRAANVYGEGQQLYRIIPRTILCCLLGQKLPLHGGGLSERSFVHFDDVSRALALVADSGVNGEDYHISPRSSIFIKDLVAKICEMAGVDFADVVELSEDRLGKDQAYFLDSEKIKTKFGWVPEVNLDDGLQRCFKWGSDNLEILRNLPQLYTHKP